MSVSSYDRGSASSHGPLSGIRVLEFAGIGPGPHVALLLADMGADVVRLERRTNGGTRAAPRDQQLRGRTIVEVDLKSSDDRPGILRLLDRADVVIEGFRPGVMERLQLGPDDVLQLNPRIVYGRMTGWGQTGPMSNLAGHDINYLSVTGLLHAIGRSGERPVPPLNLVGDFGGGSMFLLAGILAALLEREKSGSGQVIDAAMVDGAPLLGQMVWAQRAAGMWSDERGVNFLDSGAPFYDVYTCSDGKYLAVGALEPQFYAEFINGLGLDPDELPSQGAVAEWPALRETFTERIATRTRDEWESVFANTNACCTPVLTFDEAANHHHMVARGVFVDIDGAVQPGPAPRFSRTPSGTPAPPPSGVIGLNSIWQE